MAIHLVIDGYNFIYALKKPVGSQRDLEDIRDGIIEKLMGYKRLKGHRITIVFDGTKSGNSYRDAMNQGGIEIIFSKDGEEADQILKEMAKKERDSITIVTSDRAVASYAKAHGAVIIPSDEFEEILSIGSYLSIKGVVDEDDEDSNISTKKKGNPRRLSKEERKRVQRIKKL